MRASGATISATARACGVSTRTVEKWTARARLEAAALLGVDLAALGRAKKEAGKMTVEDVLKPALIDVGEVFYASGGTLPAFLDFEGRKLVLITHEEFAELVAARSKVLLDAVRVPRAGEQRSPRLGLSTIERDPEVAEFLRERFRGGITVDQLHSECFEAFGHDRTPSKQRITKFRLAVRRARR